MNLTKGGYVHSKQSKKMSVENVWLSKVKIEDKASIIDLDAKLDKEEHIKLKREEKITKAILNEECYAIHADNREIGFLIFNYGFFDQGWIELIILAAEYRGRGIGVKVFDLICKRCETKKLFTSTNRSNTRMQKALAKVGFSFVGELLGLDEGDPELFYYKKVT